MDKNNNINKINTFVVKNPTGKFLTINMDVLNKYPQNFFSLMFNSNFSDSDSREVELDFSDYFLQALEQFFDDNIEIIDFFLETRDYSIINQINEEIIKGFDFLNIERDKKICFIYFDNEE
jgi:hypothetical protein